MELILILPITASVLQNCLYNSVCKKELHTSEKINAFNFISHLICIITFGIVLLTQQLSFFTFALGLIFGVVTALSISFKMIALSIGPMHITLLITTSSMIIPTISGVFFGEKFSIFKLICVFILILFIYLCLEKVGNTKANVKWLIYCGITFVLSGLIGVLQKIHQASVYKSESGGFLFSAFLCSVFLSLICAKKELKSTIQNKRLIIIGIICGLCTFTMHYINLKMSGIIPSQIFFPIVNSVPMVLSMILSVILFKESLSLKQVAGLIGGVLTLIAICLVP